MLVTSSPLPERRSALLQRSLVLSLCHAREVWCWTKGWSTSGRPPAGGRTLLCSYPVSGWSLPLPRPAPGTRTLREPPGACRPAATTTGRHGRWGMANHPRFAGAWRHQGCPRTRRPDTPAAEARRRPELSFLPDSLERRLSAAGRRGGGDVGLQRPDPPVQGRARRRWTTSTMPP